MNVLDPQSFAASTLADSEGLAAALRTLESCLAGPDVPLDLIIQDLCAVPNLFEFIISALPSAEGLVRRILDAHPSDPALVEASSTRNLFCRFSSALFALPPDVLSTETIHYIEQSKVYAANALPILALLCSEDFSTLNTVDSPIPAHAPADLGYGNEDFLGVLAQDQKREKTRRENKEGGLAIDSTLFYELGVQIPQNNAEASRLARGMNDNLRMILKSYLELLREPSLTQPLKVAYLSTDDDMTVPVQAHIEAAESKLSAYSSVQSMKAALHFGNANGFGEWRIIISTYATKRLRELAKSDRKKCAVVVKKIKELSKGLFSDENQRKLNGTTGIPIFEAKTQWDLRLVYQVDVVSDRDEEAERQVIKIYGIYTHAHPNRIWDAIGQHLAGKGKEYCRRCIFRAPPVHAGSDVYLPASFPVEDPQNDIDLAPLVPSGQDMDELHSLLVLEKYVTFSQAFLHSLIVNQDTQHLFELTPQEHRILECTTSCYVLGRSGTGKTTTMLFKMLGIQRAWEMQKIPDMPKPRQIFVTKSDVLATKVQEYFTKLLESLALAGYSREDLKRMQARNVEPQLGAPNDRDRVGIPIPEKYSALEDNHFPLFVTFDELARMIAADVLSGNNPEARRFAKFFVNTDEIRAQDSFITYEVFARTYWPHLPQLTKGFEPWLVFSEFMGVIKGSEKSLSCPNGFLGEEAYCNLSVRTNPTFANQRQTIYAIFKAYLKLKRERRQHDVADRTHAILKMLLGGTPLRGQKVDYLYIDEAQDNLLIDALLLRFICRNPEGFFWAGDTAQTISAGSSFRFDDLKAFLYRIERDPSMHPIHDRSVADPAAFQLAVNYRSHGGIVNCAHTVIECITYFWPEAIDHLQPEHGVVDGLKPVFPDRRDQDTIRIEQFLSDECGNRVELGADQCILVRDDKAVMKLQNEVGKHNLVMTLYDSKGLEFNDVLLYNIFEDSTIDASQWRVLLNCFEREVKGQDPAKIKAPDFGRDEGRFAGLCSELKLLYVGITRARKKLWIFDKSDKGEPMRMIWAARNQLEGSQGMNVSHLAVSSTPEEWTSFGYDLFSHKKYSKAMHCFARASLPRMVAICEAFHLREVACVAQPKAQQDAFLTAADAFVASAHDAPPGKDKLQYYRNAADCYVRAGDGRKAADAYLDAREYDLAARRFRKAGLFDKTLEVLHAHSRKISSESTEELYTVCRLFYCSKVGAIRPRLLLFSSVDEELEFLEEYDLDLARARLLEHLGRHLEAAELHLSENRPLDAIRDFLKEKDSSSTIQRATRIILERLWRECSFGIPAKKVASNRDVNELLKLAGELPVDSLDPLDREEISMFHAIAQADLVGLKGLSSVFLMNRRNAAALLALDHFFSHMPVLEAYSLQEMSSFLDKFRTYARLLHSIISHCNPLNHASIKQLFCITEKSSTEYCIAPGSFLHGSAARDHHGPVHYQPSVVTLSRREAVRMLQKYLATHLCKRVTKENDLCRNAIVFSQCLTFIIDGRCDHVKCPREQVESAVWDPKRYNLCIGIYLQQFSILQLMYSVDPKQRKEVCVLDWLTRLYEAFISKSCAQGSPTDLNLSMIPGAQENLHVMKGWVRGAFYALRASKERSAFITNVLKLTSLIFAFDKSSALKRITQAPFNALRASVPELVYLDGRDVLEDIVCFVSGTWRTCISTGLLFLKHVLKSALSVDLSVLCDCLEKVIRKICISLCLSNRPPLDGLVLPRGWLTSSRDLFSKKEIDISLIMDVLKYVRDLLISLQSDRASAINSLSHTKLTPTLCDIFTARICRALCFLHHNIRHPGVKQNVGSIFDALRGSKHQKYVPAHENEYLRVMVECNTDTKTDIEDLVQLLYKRRGPQRNSSLRSPQIQHIHFTHPSQIPFLLTSRPVVAHSDLHVDTQASSSQVDDVPHAKRSQEEQTQPEEPEREPAEEVREEEEHDLVSEEPMSSHKHEPTTEEILAAEKIQAAYRRYQEHREMQTRAIGNGPKAQKNAVFIVCLKSVFASGWKRTPYRTIYLWALPCLVVCLDKAISSVQESKKKIKGQLLKGNHKHLEEAGKQMSIMNALLKDGLNLRKMIEPNATMHQDKDKDKIRKAALDIKELIHRLSGQTLTTRMQKDFRAAFELIMAEKQPVSRPEKPTLNTEDLE